MSEVIVTPVSLEELKALMREAVREEIEAKSDTAGLLLDRQQAAKALRICTKTLDTLRKRGMPCVFLGDSPRFSLPDCVEWLKKNHGTIST